MDGLLESHHTFLLCNSYSAKNLMNWNLLSAKLHQKGCFFPKERPGVRLIECQGKAGVSCLSIAVERVCYLLPNKSGLKAAPTRGMWLFWCCYPIFRMKDKQFPCRPPFPIRIALCTYFKTKLDFPDSEWGFSFNSSLLVDFNKPAPSGRSTFIFVFSHP